MVADITTRVIFCSYMKENRGYGGHYRPIHDLDAVEQHVRQLEDQADFRSIKEVDSQPLGESPGTYVVFPGELASPRSPPETPDQRDKMTRYEYEREDDRKHGRPKGFNF